jgi:hypothetical protein
MASLLNNACPCGVKEEEEEEEEGASLLVDH